MESASVGIGKVTGYCPISFQIAEQNKRVTYYLEDLRAWANGDLSDIAGVEHQVIIGLAQAVLSYTERMETITSAPKGMHRIESREDDEYYT